MKIEPTRTHLPSLKRVHMHTNQEIIALFRQSSTTGFNNVKVRI
jgi:hypothetical protein